MYTLTPQKIAEITGGTYIGDNSQRDMPVIGAVRDSNDVRSGNLFVCIQGARTDGHLFAKSAFQAGAACCLAEKELQEADGAYVIVPSTLEAIKTLAAYHRRQFAIPVVGITGSVGKTTTKELIAATLSAKFCVLKTEKNLNNELGVPLTLLSLNQNHEAAVIEMGISDFGEMSRLAQMVVPDIFVMTCIGYSHTKELGDLSGVLAAKTEAFEHMNYDGVAVLNGDDRLLRAYKSDIKKVLFGQNEYNDFRVENINIQGISSIAMDIVSSDGRFRAEIPAYGSHLAALAAAAAAVGRLLKLTDEEISAGLSTYAHVEGRSNISVENGISIINDCYNATPDSVKAALTSLSQLPCRRVAILGDMLNLGSFSDELHFEIGSFAAKRGVNLLLCHGEKALFIAEGFNAANANGGLAQHYVNFDDLLDAVPKKIKKGDAVLVKASRGMRFERVLPVLRSD